MGFSLGKVGKFLDPTGYSQSKMAFDKAKGMISGETGSGGDELGIDVADMLKRLLSSQQSAGGMISTLGLTGATSQDLAAVLKPLQDQMASLSGNNPLSGLSGLLAKSSLGSTAGASMAAVNAARLSGDGRFGSGGNAAMLAGRAATDAAVGGSAAIANALVQGKLGEANYQQGIQQQQTGLATAISQALQGQADLKEGRARLGIEQQNINQQAFANFAQIAGGVKQAKVGAKAQKDTAWIGTLGSILGG